MIYNLSGNVVNDAKMLMWCQTTHLYKLSSLLPLAVLLDKKYLSLQFYTAMCIKTQIDKFLNLGISVSSELESVSLCLCVLFHGSKTNYSCTRVTQSYYTVR